MTDKHKLEVNKRIKKSIEHLVSFEKGTEFKPELKKRLKSSSASYVLLTKSVLAYLKYPLNINNIFDNRILKIDEAFEKSLKLNQNVQLLSLKTEVSSDYQQFIKENKIPVFDNDPFGERDSLFYKLNLIDLFIKLCNEFRYEKFCYFIDEHLSIEKRKYRVRNSDHFKIEDAFPDTEYLITEFIELRVTLFYIDYLLDNVEKKHENKENIDLFKPDRRFSKIFSDHKDLKELPEIIYEFIFESKTPLDNPFFSRLRYFLNNNKYKNNCLVPKKSNKLYGNIVNDFLGGNFTPDESRHINSQYDQLEKDLKEKLKNKGLDVK